MIIVPVNQRDVQVLVVSEFFGQVQARKTAPDNDNLHTCAEISLKV